MCTLIYNQGMMNCLLIFPPGGIFQYPHLSLPILAAQLKANGCNVKCLDLNIEFTRNIFSSEYIRHSIDICKNLYDEYKNKEEELYS